jgi:hypothetical protein
MRGARAAAHDAPLVGYRRRRGTREHGSAAVRGVAEARRIEAAAMKLVVMCSLCDDQPLVGTTYWPGYDFYCPACHFHYTFKGISSVEATDELLERSARVQAEFRATKRKSGGARRQAGDG